MSPRKVVKLDDVRTEKQLQEQLDRKFRLKYMLDGKKVVATTDLFKWATWMEKNYTKRHVADDKIGKVRISTVFLALDHSFGHGPPQLFETMIFGGVHNDYCDRYSTWDEAEAGHRKALTMVRRSVSK